MTRVFISVTVRQDEGAMSADRTRGIHLYYEWIFFLTVSQLASAKELDKHAVRLLSSPAIQSIDLRCSSKEALFSLSLSLCWCPYHVCSLIP